HVSKNRLPGSLKTRQTVRALPVNTRSIFQVDFWRSASGFRNFFPTPKSSAKAYSRKEVIQPQVLLQLPCYDFTPITDHTLGTCLPCGLAQRLLVQPAFVM